MIEVLIVEDEADILDILTFNLENAGYKVLAASSAEDGIRMLGPDTALILLDVMLPGMSGFQMARQLRKENRNHIPIIFLTARGTENDILTGFSAGGDDYIAKPFSINEVLARVKAVLRRSGGESTRGDVLDFGEPFSPGTPTPISPGRPSSPASGRTLHTCSTGLSTCISRGSGASSANTGTS